MARGQGRQARRPDRLWKAYRELVAVHDWIDAVVGPRTVGIPTERMQRATEQSTAASKASRDADRAMHSLLRWHPDRTSGPWWMATREELCVEPGSELDRRLTRWGVPAVEDGGTPPPDLVRARRNAESDCKTLEATSRRLEADTQRCAQEDIATARSMTLSRRSRAPDVPHIFDGALGDADPSAFEVDVEALVRGYFEFMGRFRDILRVLVRSLADPDSWDTDPFDDVDAEQLHRTTTTLQALREQIVVLVGEPALPDDRTTMKLLHEAATVERATTEAFEVLNPMIAAIDSEKPADRRKIDRAMATIDALGRQHRRVVDKLYRHLF